MKQIIIKGLLVSGLFSLLTVAATAGTIASLSEDAMVTIERAGEQIPVTSKTEILIGDVLTVHKGTASITYGECQQTVMQQHFVKVLEGNACSAIEAIEGVTGTEGATGTNGNNKIARIDAKAATLKCTNCKVELAKQVALGKVALGVGGLLAAAVIADNLKSSPD